MTDPVVLISSGDVVGPNSSTDSSLVLFDGTTGKKIKGNNGVVTSQGLALLDDVDPAANRATIGLDQVNNTSDLNKPVSIAQQAALDTKLNVSSASAHGLVLLSSASPAATKATLALGSVDNTTDVGKPVSTAQQAALDTKLNVSSASAHGLVLLSSASAAATKTTLTLDQVNNTTDINKPVSTAQAAAIALKLNAALVYGSLGSNGYKVIDGFIVQYGSATVPSFGGMTVTFPIMFPNNCWVTLAGDQADSPSAVEPIGCQALSKSAMQVWYKVASTGSFYWLAIGI